MTLSLVYWSGPVITSAGFGGWLVALLFLVAAPIVICLIAPRHSILFGFFAVTCIEVSVILANAHSMISHGDYAFWSVFWRRDFVPHLLMWCIFALISLGVSIPVYRARRRQTA
jgi:hypothetical protein